MLCPDEGKNLGKRGCQRNVIKREGKSKTNRPVSRVDLCKWANVRTVISQGSRDEIDRRL